MNCGGVNIPMPLRVGEITGNVFPLFSSILLKYGVLSIRRILLKISIGESGRLPKTRVPFQQMIPCLKSSI
jgi:hypothetical protein